jgi:hypothetical protein
MTPVPTMRMISLWARWVWALTQFPPMRAIVAATAFFAVLMPWKK